MSVMSQIQNNASRNGQSLFLDPGSFQSITLGSLRISPFEIHQVLDVQINQEINKHGTMYVKARLADGVEERDIESFSDGKNVTLLTGDQVLFQGIIQEIEVLMIDYVYYIEIKAISYSYLLDIKPNQCSFQNKSMPYNQLIRQVTSKYSGADFIDTASNGSPIGEFIIQYRESDWKFLQRIASRFNTGLICDTRFDTPKYFFGLPNQAIIELESFNYVAKKDLKRFKHLRDNGVNGLSENDFICYEVETNQVIQVGDRVRFKGRLYHVGSVASRMEGGILLSRCMITTKNGLSQPYKPHDEIAGCSFTGKIIDIKNDHVKVHLDIDPSQSVAEAQFFPYSTPFSSKDGSGWYAMPILGDNIRLHLPDSDDSHAYAISSVHEPSTPPVNQQSSSNGASAGPPPPPSGAARDNPDIRSLRHPSGKEITLTDDGVYITDGIGSLITLTEDGIDIYSEKDIELKSEQDIVLSAEEKIQIVAEECIEISAGDTAKIRLEEDVELQGQEVKSN